MGLEFVELALRVEEEFDISLPDAKLENVKTPLDLAWYIHFELCEQREKGYSPQRGFYKLRELLMAEFSFKKNDLSPNTKIAELFKGDIRKKWKQLNKLFSNTLPSLVLNKKEHLGIFILNVFIAFLVYFIEKEWDLGLFFFFINYPILLFVYQNLFATTIPKRYKNLSSLLHLIGYSKQLHRYNNYDDILDKVIEISIDELGLATKEITPNSRYIEDLGIG